MASNPYQRAKETEDTESSVPDAAGQVSGGGAVSLVKTMGIGMAVGVVVLVLIFEMLTDRMGDDGTLRMVVQFAVAGAAIACTAVGVSTMGRQLEKNGTYAIVMGFLIGIAVGIVLPATVIRYFDEPSWQGLGVIIMGLALPPILGFIIAHRITQMVDKPPMGLYMIIFGAILMIAFIIDGTSGDPDYENLGNMYVGSFIPSLKLLLIVLIGWLYLWYVEVSHASFRFHKTFENAKMSSGTDLDLASVAGHYFGWSSFLMLIVLVITMSVLFLHGGFMYWVAHGGGIFFHGSPKFAESILFNSIYSVAIVMAFIFVPLGLILAFLFGEGSLIKSTRTIVMEKKEQKDEYADLLNTRGGSN